MKLIKKIGFLSLFLMTFPLLAQSEKGTKTWSTKTQFMVGFYHFGGYGKEKPIYYLEQYLDYQLTEKYSLGMGLGINLYPAQLASPLSVNAKYHFKLKALSAYFQQSYGYNIKLGKVFFKSSRYLGSLGLAFKSNEKISWTSDLGYAFIWDKYSGASLTLHLGIGLKFSFR